ncbi:MAG: hypothetical protein AB1631_33530 [Acidobacteriota bacterium]
MRQMISIIALVFMMSAMASAQKKSGEKRTIAYAKQALVSRLDPILPDQHLAEWLSQTVGPEAKIVWEVNDCGEQTGSRVQRGRDYPICVEARSELSGGRSIIIMIAVGTFNKGIWGQPAVKDCFIENKGQYQTIAHLSDLPKMLKSESK